MKCECPNCHSENHVTMEVYSNGGVSLNASHFREVEPYICLNCGTVYIRQDHLAYIKKAYEDEKRKKEESASRIKTAISQYQKWEKISYKDAKTKYNYGKSILEYLCKIANECYQVCEEYYTVKRYLECEDKLRKSGE